jgi:hypothetical protein
MLVQWCDGFLQEISSVREFASLSLTRVYAAPTPSFPCVRVKMGTSIPSQRAVCSTTSWARLLAGLFLTIGQFLCCYCGALTCVMQMPVSSCRGVAATACQQKKPRLVQTMAAAGLQSHGAGLPRKSCGAAACRDWSVVRVMSCGTPACRDSALQQAVELWAYM